MGKTIKNIKTGQTITKPDPVNQEVLFDGGVMIVVGAATERPERATIATGDLVGLEAFLDGLELSDDLSGSPAYKRAILRSRLRAPVEGNQCPPPRRRSPSA